MDFRLESEESVFVMRCTPTVWWTWRKWGTYSGDKETLKHSQYWSANVWRKLYTWLNFVIKMRVFESEIVRNNFWHPRNWQRLSSLPLLEEERGQFRNSGEPGRLPRRCSAKMKMLFKFSCSDESKIDKSIIPIGWLRLVKPLSFISELLIYLLCYFMLSNFPEELFPIGSLFPPITLGVFQSANLNKSSLILKCIHPPSFIQRGRIISDSNGQHSKMHSIQSLTHERMLGRQSVMGLLIMEDMGSDQWY